MKKKQLEKKISPIRDKLKEYRNENEQLKEKISQLENSKGVKIEDYERKAEFRIYLKESLLDLKNKNVSFFENKEIAGLEGIDDEISPLENIFSSLETNFDEISGLKIIEDEESSKIKKLIEKCHSNRQNNLYKKIQNQLIIIRDLYLKEKLKNEKKYRNYF